METCQLHSGIDKELSEHERRLDEYHKSMESFHRRLDEMAVVMDAHVDRISSRLYSIEDTLRIKLSEYGNQIKDHFNQSLDLYNNPEHGIIFGKDGIAKEVETLKRFRKIFVTTILIGVPFVGWILVYFRENFGRLAKAFFFDK